LLGEAEAVHLMIVEACAGAEPINGVTAAMAIIPAAAELDRRVARTFICAPRS
jgi:hypothetical protein